VHCLCFTLACSQKAGLHRKHAYRVCPEQFLRACALIAGDFNDWRNQMSRVLESELDVHDVFHLHDGSPARSFPARLPMFRLDRIYVRGFSVCT